MAEQYELAAARHHKVAELLQKAGEIDDAAYHFGVCGENALKFALQAAGVEAYWDSEGRPPQSTPMRGHFEDLHKKVAASQAEIALNASGRLSNQISAVVLSPTFSTYFQGWSINIRYADTGCTPVQEADCTRWSTEATDLMLSLVMH